MDVNVHPSKLEVKFSKEYELKQLIFDAVSKTLENVNLTYQVKEERPIFKPQLDQMDLDIDFRQEIPTKVQKKPQASFIQEKKQPLFVHEEKNEYRYYLEQLPMEGDYDNEVHRYIDNLENEIRHQNKEDFDYCVDQLVDYYYQNQEIYFDNNAE